MGGLLDYLRDYGSGVKQRFGLLADNPAEFTRQALLDVVPNRDEALAAQARLMGGQVDPQAYKSYMNKMQDIGGLLGSIRVYHGSPHKFDKFDLSKIGTGEGAQAYGHGAYFADNRAVAQQYADALGSVHSKGFSVDGVDGSVELPPWVVEKLKNKWASVDDIIGEFNGRIAEAEANKSRSLQPWLVDSQIEALNKNIATLERLRGVNLDSATQGHLYNADLRWPDAAREAADPLGPQHFLDWDKPLSEQPAAVRDSVKRAFDEIFAGNGAAHYEGAVRQGMTVGEVVQQLSGRGPASGKMAAQTSARFADAGIPGIRYLDAGSRGAGQGSSNYVVFDDALIDILTRNGIPVKK